jgi:ABC-2 type transport system ATP-binding protein
MEATADHVVVIGKGRLIADESIETFTKRSTGTHVRVVTPDSAGLVPLLRRAGATVSEQDGALIVTGMEVAAIGVVAASNAIELHELSPRRASLEVAFMELTEGSQQYQGAAAASHGN